MSMDSREQFEAWVKTLGFSKARHPANRDMYDNYTVDSMWDAWQASRAAVVVPVANAELIEAVEWLMEAACEYKLPAHLMDAVKAAGVKVAP